jgi:hypothetical protein
MAYADSQRVTTDVKTRFLSRGSFADQSESTLCLGEGDPSLRLENTQTPKLTAEIIPRAKNVKAYFEEVIPSGELYR